MEEAKGPVGCRCAGGVVSGVCAAGEGRGGAGVEGE